MTPSPSLPPSPDELELSLFGPGYGEALLVHLGAGKWILVDSCLHCDSSQPAALAYLHELGVDIAQAVELIVATHWHDDHIRGISAALRECTGADLAVSGAINHEEFFTLVSSYLVPSIMESTGVDELRQVLKTLQARKSRGDRYNPPRYAVADKILYHDSVKLGTSDVTATVSALSPSDASLLQAQLSFARILASQQQARTRVAPPSPNSASVVLWIEVGSHRLLLGSDLEVTHQPNTGWSAILDDALLVTERAGIFKIPHHGSKNAHHPRVWSELLLDDPLALLTPFRRGRTSLPSPEDSARICALTPNAYMTSPVRHQPYKFRNKTVRKTLRSVGCEIRRAHSGWGQIRVRQSIDQADPPCIELFGDACPLDCP